MLRRSLWICLLAFLALPVQAQPADALGRAIDAVLDDDTFSNAHWGALVVDLTTGGVLYRRNEGKSFTPASNTKLYTTAAALDQLGPDYRYRTVLYADGNVVGGVLRGNLIVRGAGDPAIGGRFTDGDRTATFRAWADSLRARGITRVEGDLIGDDDLFDDTPLGYGWSWDDETYWYAAEVGALSFNDNNVDVAIDGRGVGEPGRVSWEPAGTDYIRVVNRTLTVPASERIDEGYARARGTNTLVLSSRVPAGRTDHESLTITNPTRFFVHVLREVLLAEGVLVEGRPVDVDDLSIRPDYAAPGLRRVASYTAPPLSEIVDVINKRSQNLYAEQVLRTLGAERPVLDDDDLEAGSAAMGVAAAHRTFAAAGVDTSRLQLVDGSGLSRLNFVTPAMTMALLRHMWTHPDAGVRAAFLASLPVGGVDGTLEYRFRDGPARGRVQAKTGTLSNGSALSGYVEAADGTPLAFVLMVNHYTGARSRVAKAAEDRVVALLARHRP